MGYQTFGSERGNSDSLGKYNSLKLNQKTVKDKVVLDIGCNEGYFCIKMAELGAKRVIGIDKTEKWITLANKNKRDNIEYITSDLSYLETLQNNSIDIVLILSAMHYMCNPEDRDNNDTPLFLFEIKRVLKNGGTFVFEGGVEFNDENSKFIKLKRNIGDTVYHPTKNKIEDLFEKIFGECQYIGPSVKQAGDPIDRHVYYGVKKCQDHH